MSLLESTKEEKIIEITSQLDERNYKIIIENNGKQIPNNIIEKIYNPYFSTKNEKNKQKHSINRYRSSSGTKG